MDFESKEIMQAMLGDAKLSTMRDLIALSNPNEFKDIMSETDIDKLIEDIDDAIRDHGDITLRELASIKGISMEEAVEEGLNNINL